MNKYIIVDGSPDAGCPAWWPIHFEGPQAAVEHYNRVLKHTGPHTFTQQKDSIWPCWQAADGAQVIGLPHHKDNTDGWAEAIAAYE